MKVHLQLVIFHFLVSAVLSYTSALETSEGGAPLSESTVHTSQTAQKAICSYVAFSFIQAGATDNNKEGSCAGTKT